jgi:hypothetical protein
MSDLKALELYWSLGGKQEANQVKDNMSSQSSEEQHE